MKPAWLRHKPSFWIGAALSLIVLLIILTTVSGRIVEWLWMRQLGYENIFWRLLAVKWTLFALAFAGVFICLWANLHFIMKGGSIFEGEQTKIPARAAAKLLPVFLSLVVALIFARIFYQEWETCIRFFWGGAFNQADPIYGRDIGFYLFRLPFYQLIQNGVVGLALTTLVIILLAYASLGRSGMNV